LDEQIAERQKAIEELGKKYEQKIKEAEKERITLVAKPNDYVKLREDIALENKTFFVKRKILTGEFKKVPPAPSGIAEMGGFSDIKSAEKTVRGIKAVEFPELVRIAKELSGDYPTLRKFKQAKGKFYVKTGKIKLDYDIFKDPELAGKVLAHEVGHLSDFLPDRTLARGNLVGRVATLVNQLKWKYKDLDNKVLREELRGLSQAWKPFDETQSESFTKYRYSAIELYADAISVLLNDPDLLKEKAPNFFKGFFDYIDEKPAVKENFFTIWELLNRGQDAIFAEREKSLRESFKRGEDEYAVLRTEREKKDKDYTFRMKYLLVEKGQKIYDYVKRAKKEGKPVNDDQNPVYWFEEQKYVGGIVKNWMEANIQPIYRSVMGSGTTWEDFGEVLFHERVMNERGELANPLGFSPETSREQLSYLERRLGTEKWNVIQTNLPKYREAIAKITDMGIEAGLYTKELIEQMKANPAYATFQVIDYLDLYIPASIKHQVGTLKEVANPADATVIKSISIIYASQRNMAKKSVVELVKERFSAEIEQAKTIWTGRYHQPIDSKDPTKGLLTVMEEGKVKGYYVDPYIVKSFDYMDTGAIKGVARLFGVRFLNSHLFRPLFITFNLGFQTFNIMRDFMRFYKNVPNMSLFRAFVRYGQSVPSAFRRAWNLPDATISEMEKAQILSITYNDVVQGRDEQAKQIEYIMERVGVTPLRGKKRRIFNPFKLLLNQIENLGNMIETIPKVAGYKELNNKMPPKEMASFIRRYVGSPDFLAGGAAKPLSNEVFLFSNAMTQGVRSDIDIAVNPKTRSGYWWKTAWVSLLPKVLMYAALYGLFGDLLKEMMEDASEYDKANYSIIPLTRENGRTTYLRIPQDETGRVIGGIFWKALRIADGQKPILPDLSDILSYTGGQLPSPSPAIESVFSIAQYLAGQNPYDFFRGRNVLSDEEFKAGGWYAFKPYITWQINQLGGGIFWRGYASMQTLTDKTFLQKMVEAPVMSNILGRWIRVSSAGQREINRDIITGVAKEEARERLENREKINEAVRQYTSGTQNMTRRLEIERQLVKDVVGNPPYTKERKTAKTNTIKKFKIALIKGEADQNINAVISATSNEQKVTLLRQIKTQMDDQEYRNLVQLLKREKIISDNVIKELRK